MKIASLLFATALALVACSKDKPADGAGDKPAAGGAAATKAADPGAEFAIERAKENLAEVKQKLAGGNTDLGISCAATTGYTDQLKDEPAAKEIVAEAEQVCNHDVPLAAAKAAVEKAEAARKAKPGPDEVVSECFSVEWKMAVDTLVETKHEDDALKALRDRWAAVCPEK